MPKITYIQANGNAYDVEVNNGSTVMEGAVNNMIDGIVAECGGNCSCATCHCYVDDLWLDQVGPPDELEAAMLEAVIEPKDNSRLSCQIKVVEALDGLIVRLPISQ